MRLSLCNEVIAEMPYAKQCEYAAQLGYDGLEVAPYTLAESPERMTPAQVAEARRATADAGIAVTGLHWLLVKPAGLSISTRDDAVRQRTLDVMFALIDLCAELGGRYLVHGSPGQRRIDAGDTHAAAFARAQACWAAAGEHAAKAGVVYCVEPLTAEATPPSKIAQGMGLATTPLSAFLTALLAPCSSAPSRRDSAMHNEVVMTMSTTIVTIIGPAACAPSKATSSGTPMKPVLGKAATSAPKEASFQPMRRFRLMATANPTMTSAHSNQVKNTLASSNCAIGVDAPKRYSMQGSAKNSTKLFRPGMASSGNMRRRAAI